MAGMVSACSSVPVILWDTLCSSGKEKEGATDRSTVRQSIVGCGCDNMVYFETAGSDFVEWGNRRGMLWQMAWQGFCRGDLKQKLLGAGPDCFAGYLEQVLPGGTVLFDKGYFAGSIFTNAHNEWLTTLINLGVLGTAAYAAVFLTALRKYRRNSMAIMLLFTYGMYSLISFQQVLNTPFFFLLLGVCEAEQRMNQQYNTDTHEESIEVG